MRLFVAVDTPDAIKQAVESDVVDVLREHLRGARWTRPDGRHLTLKFLGNVESGRVEDVRAALDSAATRHVGFRASFAEIGAFPNLRRPRVVWIGVGEGSEPMRELVSDIERELEPLGFAPEERPFRGHLTLARFPRPRTIAALPEIVVPSEAFGVTEVVLFQSQLHPKGARYTALARVALSPPSD